MCKKSPFALHLLMFVPILKADVFSDLLWSFFKHSRLPVLYTPFVAEAPWNFFDGNHLVAEARVFLLRGSSILQGDGVVFVVVGVQSALDSARAPIC